MQNQALKKLLSSSLQPTEEKLHFIEVAIDLQRIKNMHGRRD